MGTLADFDALVARPRTRTASACCSTSCRTTRASSTRGSSTPRSSRTARAPRLVRLGRSRARRLAAEQLGEQLRRSGVDARRRDRPVLHAQPPARAARPELVERRRARRVRRHPPVLVRPRRRRVPHRRVQHDRQGRRAARQPARDRRRSRSTCRCSGNAPSTTGTGPRCTTCCAAGARSPTRTTRPALLLGETPVDDAATLGAFYGADLDELHLAFNFPFINAPFEAAAMRDGRRGASRRCCPPGAWPAWTGSNHDMSRFATRWAGDDPAQDARRVADAARPARHAGALPGRRDRSRRRRGRPPDLRDPLGVQYWPRYAGRDAMRTPMPWRDVPGGGFTEPGVEPWLPLGDTDAQRRATSAPTRRRCSPRARPHRAPRARTPDLSPGLEHRPVARGRVGVAPRRAARGRRQLRRRFPLARAPRRADPARDGPHPRRGAGRGLRSTSPVTRRSSSKRRDIRVRSGLGSGQRSRPGVS